LEDLLWENFKPHVNEQAADFCGGRGSRSASASCAGAFYLQIDKIGVVRSRGSLVAFIGYQVKDFWITSLLSAQKITFEAARSLYVQNVVRAEVNIRQAEFVENIWMGWRLLTRRHASWRS
jgi:hypothetical protein